MLYSPTVRARAIARNLVVALIAAIVAGTAAPRAAAQATVRKPQPWLLSVSHRVELSQSLGKVAAPAASDSSASRVVINLTSGILVDREGHVVTRLVNLNPTLARQDIAVTTSTGRIYPASFVGLDGPSGLVILQVPELKGTEPAPAAATPNLTDPSNVRLVTPIYSNRQFLIPVRRVAIYPELQAVDATLVGLNQSAETARHGRVGSIESASLSSSGDLSMVETTGGELIGLVRYLAPGRGDVLSVPFVRDVVAARVISSSGSVQAGWLGAVGMSLREVPAFRRPTWAPADGVLIEMISSKGPADQAGLQLNDLVVGIDGVPVRTTADLAALVTSTPAGTRVNIDAVRDGSPVRLATVLGGKPLAVGGVPTSMPSEIHLAEIRLADLRAQLARSKDAESRAKLTAQIAQVEREIDLMRSASPTPPASASSSTIGAASLGIALRAAPPQVAEQSGVKSGLFVDEVKAASPAAEAGLLATDIIVQVGQIKVADPVSFDGAVRAAAATGAEFVDIAIVRSKQPLSVRVVLARASSAKP